MIILDTNVLSALMRQGHDDGVRDWLDTQQVESIYSTAITVFEIRVGLATLPTGRRRNRLETDFRTVVKACLDDRILPLDNAAAESAATLMAARRSAGIGSSLSDAMIAGIAISRGATLATRNVRHFADLPVPVVNPWEA